MTSAVKSSNYMPATDIVEMEDGVHIFMDLPGVPPENLSVDLEENEIVIRGESVYGVGEEAGHVLHAEFEGVTFQRSFTLTDMIDRDKVTAVLTEGVLDLFMPRADAMKPRRIEIL